MRGTIDVPRKLIKSLAKYTYLKKGFKKDIPTPSWSIDGDMVRIPRNISKFRENFPNLNIIDCTYDVLLDEPRQVLDNFELREYQKEPTKSILEAYNANYRDILLFAETGFGKTTVLPYIITNLGRKTLIVTDRKLLNQQMMSSIEKFSNLRIAELSRKTNVNDFDVITTTFQFANRNEDLMRFISNRFGMLVVDEVHIVGAKSYLKLIDTINSKFRLGLSATPTRSDGLDGILTDTLEYKVLGKNPNKLIPDLFMLDYPLYCDMEDNYKKAVGVFLERPIVSNLVLPMIKDALLKNRRIFLVIDVQSTQEYYKEVLSKDGIKCAIINATTKNRQEYFDGIENGSVEVLIGFGVLEKGVDVPRLDTVFHLSGMTTKEKMEQTIGRATREHPDKNKPLVIDFGFQGVLMRSGEKRYEIYKQFHKDRKINFNYKFIKEII